MGEPGPSVAYPTLAQAVDVNREMIAQHGGLFVPPDNLRAASLLEYALTVMSEPIYGQHLYPSLKDKAAALCTRIIVGHVFWDGNKRTAVHLAWSFLRHNGVGIQLDASIEAVAVQIASGEAGHAELLRWLHAHQ